MRINFKVLFKLIVAQAKNGIIGKDNALIWHLPNDLKRFKALTTGQVVIMGRKTYASIGRPLPNRHNIVLSRQGQAPEEGIHWVQNLADALRLADTFHTEHVFLIGGEALYRQGLPLVQEVLLTQLEVDFEGDAAFPTLDPKDWVVMAEEPGVLDDKNTIPHRFITLRPRAYHGA